MIRTGNTRIESIRARRPLSVRWWALAAVLLLVAGLSACGSSDDDGDGDGSGAISVTHAKGTAELPGAPERIVAVGSGDVQIAVALGGDVVGAVANPSAPDKNWPGTSPALPASVMSLDSMTPQHRGDRGAPPGRHPRHHRTAAVHRQVRRTVAHRTDGRVQDRAVRRLG
ncbi:hypothetical protein ACFOJ6_05670 [Gordonia humi]|uniref:hypothetical protein n=1 Tax=Gordonia humi TaxID=686429 RepID=UPI003608BA64